MRVVKAEFKDEAGKYTMTFSFNPDLYTIAEIVAHEMDKSNSKLIRIISNEELN
jgi:hypothetical protein